MHTPIFLIGLTHVGKSSIGKSLSEKIGCPFVDTDTEIEKKALMTVAMIFDQMGESAFREYETQAIQGINASQLAVVAIGAGGILKEQNRDLIRQNGLVVYLEASPDEIVSRIQFETDRPLLAGKDQSYTLKKMSAARVPFYQSCAHITVNLNGKTLESGCSETHQAIEKHFDLNSSDSSESS